MDKQEIDEKLDRIIQEVRKRMAVADPQIVSLLPTEMDWMTSEERTEFHELKMQLPSHGEEMLAARARLKAKREARMVAVVQRKNTGL